MKQPRIFLTLLATALWGLGAGAAQPGTQGSPQTAEAKDKALTPDEARALAERAIAGQHADDAAQDEFERIEHIEVRSGGPNSAILQNKTYRVVPTGTGTLKLLLKDGSSPVSADFYRQQLRAWERVLQIAIHPDDPRERAVYAKWQKKSRERKELVDSTRDAFRATYAGREVRDARSLVILQLEPNPNYQPKTAAQDVLSHARARIWVDEKSGHLARGEADIIRDVSFGGGFIGKLYKGAHFTLERAEAAPGVWLPIRSQNDYAGRKFLFTFEQHEVAEVRNYRRLGGPKEALAAVEKELKGDVTVGDP